MTKTEPANSVAPRPERKVKEKREATADEMLAASLTFFMENAEGLGIVRKTTMRQYRAALAGRADDETPLDPAAIVTIRKRENVSQAVLAAHIGVGGRAVGGWESRPNDRAGRPPRCSRSSPARG